MAAAEVLKITHNLEDNVKTVVVKVQGVDGAIQGVDNEVKGVHDRVKGADYGVKVVGDKSIWSSKLSCLSFPSIRPRLTFHSLQKRPD